MGAWEAKAAAIRLWSCGYLDCFREGYVAPCGTHREIADALDRAYAAGREAGLAEVDADPLLDALAALKLCPHPTPLCDEMAAVWHHALTLAAAIEAVRGGS